MQVDVACELAVSQLAPIDRTDDAICDREPRSLDAKALRREIDEDRSHLGARKTQRHATVFDRLAAGCDALVWGFLGISGDHVQACQRQVEFLHGDLRERRHDALAEFHFASAHCDAAVGRNADPGIEHAVAVEAARQRGRLLGEGKLRSEREGDHDAAKTCTKTGCKIPSRDVRAHQILPFAWLVLSTARMMRPWVPQRHRLPASPSRTCASVGCGFWSSSAFADMIMPLMQ